MDVTGFLSHLRGLRSYKDQIAHLEDIPPRSPAYGRLDRPLNPALEAALRSAGISDLYSHQAEAINALGRGENIIVSTPAASGKSLCYHLPVLEALLEDRAAYAMYLFPAKALARDQARSFEKLIPESARLRFGVFDGDTPSEDRADVRRSSRLVLTNPDMLHVGILPNHRTWYHVLRGLRYVVIDEAHIYRGVFGSHVANVIRRLRRLCRRFGNEPQFILCSATTANPGEHAESLTGLPFTVIQDDGSPFGGKDFVFAHPSADVAALVTALVRGAFEYQGQKCSAASRAYIPASLWSQVKELLVDTVGELRMGPPTDFRNFLCAVIDRPAFDSISNFIDEANAKPEYEVLVGGSYDDSRGYFVEPTVVQAQDAGARLMCEEIFGPVLTVYVYDDADMDETLDLCDTGSPYALTGAIFAQDRRDIVRLSKRLKHAAGNFYINDKPTGAVVGQQPFGGARASGTNDKAGSPANLMRWVSQRTVKETFVPATSYEYPFMGDD